MFEWFKELFPNGWCTKAELIQAVQEGKVTPEQYQQVTGEVYSA